MTTADKLKNNVDKINKVKKERIKKENDDLACSLAALLLICAIATSKRKKWWER
jgi:UV DNA damage repair endonuclease